MACRKAYKNVTTIAEAERVQRSVSEPVVAQKVDRLLFGVDSETQANDLLPPYKRRN